MRSISNSKLHIKGFSITAALLILVLIILLAFGGWFIWYKNHKPNPPTSQKDKTTPSTQEQPTSQPFPTPDPSEGGTYLVITEWGVRFPLPAELRGEVRYGVASEAGLIIASFEVGRIANLPGSNCKLHNEPDNTGISGGIGVLLIRRSEPFSSHEAQAYSSTVPYHGGYWYYIGPSKGSCVAGSDNDQLEGDTAHALIDALEKLEGIPEQ